MAVVINHEHFDVFNFVKKAKEFGLNEQFAEYEARQIEKAIEIAVSTARLEMETKDLATKTDIEIVRKEIELAINKTILWVVGILSGYGIFFLGVLAKGFHWL